MADPRVELTGLSDGPAAGQVLDHLDRVQVVLELADGRAAEQDLMGLTNLVNVAARIFPHWEIRVPAGVACSSALLGEGDLAEILEQLVRDVSPAPTRNPEHRYTIAWGRDPSGPGLALDARGWSCSLGPHHLPLDVDGGPHLGALAVGYWATGQLLFAALSELGLPGHATEGFRWNLLDYQLAPARATQAPATAALPALTCAGCGSVGSSFIYAALLARVSGGPVGLVDPDAFSERNVLRYPILQDVPADAKAAWLAELCNSHGISATAHSQELIDYTNSFDSPPRIELAIVSVDTLIGRRDATDLLAARTLNIGVAGLSLHVSRHCFGEDGCAYCQYVDVAPATSGAEALAGVIGLPVERVLAIEQGDGRIDLTDAETLAAAGRYGQNPPRPGQRLVDVRRRAYAQASIPTREGDLRVSAPHVSGMAGTVALAEAIKHADPALRATRLKGRLALDLSGQPSGFTLATGADRSGRCLCHSPFRRRAWAQLHADRP